jgi:tetratricopeptide (TPR) repeat protein
MASTRQIENLERKHRENPEGLTFAPLANAYRNSGQPERAIEILTDGLAHHPEHAPARIVLGRCHVDLGDDSAAETAFAAVLELDQENVVALKSLADITERSKNYPESIRWLNYLLEIDRNNDEAREQLARVTEAAEAPQPEEAPPAAEETDASAPEVEPTAEVGGGTIGGISPFEPPTGSDEFSEPVSVEDAVPADPLVESSLPESADEDQPTSAPEDVVFGSWEPPAPTPEVVEGFEAGEFEGPADGIPEIDGLEPHQFEGADEATPALDGLESAEFEAPNHADPPGKDEEMEQPVDDEREVSLSIDTEDDIVLNASGEDNEYQAPDASGSLSIEAAGETEYQVASTADELLLRPSGPNEFQGPEELGLVSSRHDDEEPEDVESEDLGSEDVPEAVDETVKEAESATPDEPDAVPWWERGADPVEPEAAAPEADVIKPVTPPSSWFAPADEDPIPSVSQSDGTVEPLDSVTESEIPPFEEAESLPSAWSPAGTDSSGYDALASMPAEEPEPAFDALPEDPITGNEEPDLAEAPTETEDEEVPAFGASDDELDEIVTVHDSEPDIVATETMAELYLSQGHRHEALEVYRILWRESPDDQRLREKVEALESELEKATLAEAASEAVADSAWDEVTISDTAEPAKDYAISKTGGQRTKSFFKSLLTARPASTPEVSEEPEESSAVGSEAQAGEVVGEPTRPAQDRLSLSAVFGEDTSPVPPAVGGAEAAEGESGDGFSFDSFFGGERGGASRSRPTSTQARSQEDEADLDQFHAWLQGLKG